MHQKAEPSRALAQLWQRDIDAGRDPLAIIPPVEVGPPPPKAVVVPTIPRPDWQAINAELERGEREEKMRVRQLVAEAEAARLEEEPTKPSRPPAKRPRWPWKDAS